MLGIHIQSLIAKALDEDNHTIVASIDLSLVFDVVNIELLLKRLRVVGLPEKLVALTEIWLTDRVFYFKVIGTTSIFYDSKSGTLQGLILRPILYAIFVAPLFDLTDLLNFADDKFTLSTSKNKQQALQILTEKLTLIKKWLKDSGLSVNESKNEVCAFHRRHTPNIEIVLNNVTVKSKQTMNVLGVLFDSTLSWAQQSDVLEENNIYRLQK